jgi:hypothetical protein
MCLCVCVCVFVCGCLSLSLNVYIYCIYIHTYLRFVCVCVYLDFVGVFVDVLGGPELENEKNVVHAAGPQNGRFVLAHCGCEDQRKETRCVCVSEDGAKSDVCRL